MTKDEYLKKKAHIQEKLKALGEELSAIKEVYKSTNFKFEIGDKVKVTTEFNNWWEKTNETRTEFGIVDGVEISYNDEVIPIVYKLKKDGTKAQVGKLSISFNSIIEKV